MKKIELLFQSIYEPKVEIKGFNLLIDAKPFFEIPVKNKEEAYEAITEISKNNDYTTDNLLGYEYFKDHYKVIAINFRKQTELENTDLKQQICFIGRLENNATGFFIIEKKEETTFDFSQNYANLQQENGTLLTIKIMDNMEEEMKMIQLLNLKQKPLNQIFVIIQTHIVL